jgi:hypothetical protein
MSSSETARRLIRQNQDMFEALLDFERTKRVPKLNRKARANFTIDSNLYHEFRREAQRRGLQMSNVIEASIRERLRLWRLEK